MVAQFTDRDLADRMVSYPSEGVTVTAFMIGPKPGGRYPAIVVVQEWWGLNEHMKDVARRYAREGYIAIVPDLYSRLGHKVTADPNEAGTLMQRLEQAEGLKDLNATFRHLRKVDGGDTGRVGRTGF